MGQIQGKLRRLLARIRGTSYEEPVKQGPSYDPELRSEDDRPPVYLNIGIDFGTSFTKVCYRDVARDLSKVVFFTKNCSRLEEAILPSSLYCFERQGFWEVEFLPVGNSSEGALPINYIKMRLAGLDHPESERFWGEAADHLLDEDYKVEAICAYYLAQVLCKAQHWILTEESSLVAGRRICWSANVGVPVEYFDSPAIKRFRKVLSAAWHLSQNLKSGPIRLDRLWQVYRSAVADNGQLPVDIEATPEIAGAIQSFVVSSEAKDGLYIFFDVGAGTLDGVSFRFHRTDGESKVSFFSGKVASVGVQALCSRLAGPNPKSHEGWIAKLFGEESSALISNPSCQSDLQGIQKLVGKVVYEAKQKDPLGLSETRNNPYLHLFLGGGGSQAQFYEHAIDSAHQARNLEYWNIPPFKLRQLPLPTDFSMGELNDVFFHRFAIAYGLSIPVGEQAETKLPSHIKKLQKNFIRKKVDTVDYEDSKDCYE